MIRSLEAKGLVSRRAGKEARFVPARPDIAIENLILDRQEELEKARVAAAQLAQTFQLPPGAPAPVELIEVMTGREAVTYRFAQLQRLAKREVLVFDKPPYVSPTAEQSHLELQLLERGVRYRAIYDQEALALEGQLQHLEDLAAAGEEARVLSGVPMKLAIADGTTGLIPLNMTGPGMEGALLVHPSSLLDALRMFFEELWRRAIPLGGGQAQDATEGIADLGPEDHRVLSLLAAGLKDEVVARQMGVGVRTVRRRISDLMRLLGAKTRFQAGLQTARRGWI